MADMIIKMTPAATTDLNFKYNNGPTDSSVVYTSSAPGVAAVNAQGIVTAAGAGTASITVKSPSPSSLTLGTVIVQVSGAPAPSATVTSKPSPVVSGAVSSLSKLTRSAVAISPTNVLAASVSGSSGVYTISNSPIKLFGQGMTTGFNPHVMFNASTDNFWSHDSAFFEDASYTIKKRYYVGIDFGSAKMIYKIKITASSQTTYRDMTPTSFKLEGSNDTTDGKNGTWVDLQVAGELGVYGKVWKAGEAREFLTRGTAALQPFKAIRIHSPNKISIATLEVFSNQISVISPQVMADPLNVSNPTAATYIHNDTGMIMYGPHLDGNFAWRAFAPASEFPFIADSSASYNTALGGGLKSSLLFMYPLGSSKQIVAKFIRIRSGSTSSKIPKYFLLQGLTATGTWETIFAGGNQNWAPNTLETFLVEKTEKYGGFRLVSSVENMEIAYFEISGFDDTLVSGL